MMKHRHYLLTALFVCSLATAFGQQRYVSLAAAYEAAIRQYPGIMAKQAEIKASRYREKQVASQNLPQANLQLQNSFGTLESSVGSFFPLPGTFNVSGNQAPGSDVTHTTYASIVADWEIYSFGKHRKEKQAAARQVEESKSGLNAYELSLKSTVSRLFFTVLHHQVKLDWANRNTERVNDILKLSISLASAGLTPGADTALASSSHLQIQSDHFLWTGMFQASKLALNEFTALGDFHVNSAPFLSLSTLNSPQTSLSAHPVLAHWSDKIGVQRSLMEAENKRALPSLSILGGLSSRGSGADNHWVSKEWKDGFRHGKNNYLVGLGMKWSLTGIYQSKLAHKKIEQTMRIAEAEYQLRERQLQTAIQSSEAKLREQRKQVGNTNAAVERAKEAYFLYRTRYENGLINLTELLQIQQLLQQAEAKQIDAFKGYWEQLIARAEASGTFESLVDILNQTENL